MSSKIFCSKCGFENSLENDFCIKCGFVLRKITEFGEPEVIVNRNQIFSNHHKEKLNIRYFKSNVYDLILEIIYEQGKNGLKNKKARNIFEEITNIVEAYATWDYKSRGEELGFYVANTIRLDDRLDTSNKIATLIHELAHHIFAEIFEQILMYLWNVKKSIDLEVFAKVVTSSSLLAIANEYCAHTVEGRFIPHGFQNYGSFNALVNEFSKDIEKEAVFFAVVLGNTIAEDIIDLFDKFIGFDLRERIKKQYKADNIQPRYDQIVLETKETFDSEQRDEFLINFISGGYDAFQEDPKLYEFYDKVKESFIHPECI